MRPIPLIILSLACSILSASQTQAFGPEVQYPDVEQDAPLSSAELITAFKGQTHLGTYNFLHKNITTFAFEETTYADGKIRHEQQGIIDKGYWTISEDKICYNYDDPSLLQACFHIYVRGNCYYHYQISTNGVARFGFTARSVIAGETPNCEPSFV